MGITASAVWPSSSATVSPVLPPDGETNASNPASLGVWISDAQQTNLTVAFYGRAMVSRPDFTVIALPDTQCYCARRNGGTPEIFAAQVDWIVANRVSRNIACVTHLGDIVDNGDSQEAEWWAATNAMYRLEDPFTTGLEHGIPYGMAMGNHDGNQAGGYTAYWFYHRYSVLYNRYFGASRFAGRPYYGGHFGTNNNNHFLLFSASSLDFLVLHLEYACGTNAAVMSWANQVLQSNLNRRAIVVSHSLLYAQGTNNTNPFYREFSPEGRPIYDALKANTNIFMMLCGHDPQSGIRQEIFNGNAINILLADYENAANGGNGWLRTLEFSPSNNLIRVRTYSPTLSQFNNQPAHWFNLGYDMLGYSLLRTLTNAGPGLVVSGALTNLPDGRDLEWYAEVGDGAVVSRSLVSRFRLAAPSDPVASRPLEICTLLRSQQGHVFIGWRSTGGLRYRTEFSNGDRDGGFTGLFQEIVRPVEDETDPAPEGTPGVRYFVDDFTLTDRPPPPGARYFRVKQVR